MRARSLALVVATTLALLATQVFVAYAAAPVAERYIVLFRPDADARGIVTALEHAHRFTSDFRYEALKGFAARLTPAQLALVRAHPAVAVISADQAVEAVGSVPLAAGETAPSGVRRIDAATNTTANAASTVAVAVIDTGVSLAHPDLNAVSGKNCITPGASANDDNGHGTHVAGTIAAKNTGSGVVGVAPNTTVYAVKVLNSAGSGTWAQVICGIDWATANGPSLGIKVANMSLGGGGSSDSNCGYNNGDALHQAICRSTAAGITYAVAAGNSGVSFSGQVPAAYPEVLAVTAMSDSDGVAGATGGRPTCRTSESDDAYATFSNFAVSTGAQSHTVAGPGVCIYSTWLNGGYNTISGTSMATPHLAGTIALCFGSGGVAGPCAGLSPASVIQRIRSDAQAHATATNGFSGDPSHPVGSHYYGYLALAGAYTGSGAPPPPPPPPPPLPPSDDPIVNGGFETGTLSGWTASGAAVAVTSPHSGAYAARVGSASPFNGDSAVAQTFTVPSGRTQLSFWYRIVCTDSVIYDWATATLRDNTTGTTTTVLPRTCSNNGAWAQRTVSVTASHSYTLTLIDHDDNWPGDPTYTLYDDVTVQ